MNDVSCFASTSMEKNTAENLTHHMRTQNKIIGVRKIKKKRAKEVTLLRYHYFDAS